MAGFNTAVTGIKAATTDLDVAGNNIANSSTVGFKSSRTEFADIYATAVVGAGSSNTPGSGVTVSDIAQDFSAGTIEFTNNNLDLAINGSGFFQLDDGQGGVTYTRAGAFELNKDGFIVSKSGKFLQGYGLDSAGNRLPIGDLAVTQKESPPKATESVDLSFNIDSREDATLLLSPYSKDEPSSFTYSTTIRTFDSLGNEHTVKFNMVEQRPEKEVHTYDVNTGGGTTVTLSGVTLDLATNFNANGELADNLPAAANTLLTDLKTADPRIFGVEWDSVNSKLNVIFKSDSLEYGALVAQDGAATLTNETVANTPSNELHQFNMAAASFTGTTLEFEVAGVQFSLDATTSILTADDIGAEIVAKQSAIIDNNPDIESVTFDGNANGGVGAIIVTYKADAGNVGDELAQAKYVSGTNPFAGTPNVTTNIIAADDITTGDNSYQGVYRMYAYLNGEEALNLGKVPDPGTGRNVPEVGPVIVKFSPTNGILSAVNGQTVRPGAAVPGLSITGADPADPDTIIDFSLEGSTQFASSSIVKASTQDGYTKGDLIGVTFAGTGEMVASFSNGQNSNLGVVAIATFENQSGLQPNGDTEWSATLTSGDAILNPPGTGLNGTLRSAALEQSNVDLSAELVKLIEAQRNYQANSKTLETLNTVTQAILQI